MTELMESNAEIMFFLSDSHLFVFLLNSPSESDQDDIWGVSEQRREVTDDRIDGE